MPIGTISIDIVKIVFDFAYQMTFVEANEHRSYRTDVTYQRSNSEIFANTFQRKLAEFALCCILYDNNIEFSKLRSF